MICQNEKIILPDDPEAAEFVENISGWMSRNGEFYGKMESMARYAGSTHKLCMGCGEPVKKLSYCKKCHKIKDFEAYKKAEKKEWDGKSLLYSNVYDVFVSDVEEVTDLMNKEGATYVEQLELYICEPRGFAKITTDYWDDIGEEGIFNCEILEAIERLNNALENAGSIYHVPTRVAAKLTNIFIGEKSV